MIEKYVKNKVK